MIFSAVPTFAQEEKTNTWKDLTVGNILILNIQAMRAEGVKDFTFKSCKDCVGPILIEASKAKDYVDFDKLPYSARAKEYLKF